jgi:hypothetical protein
MKHSQLAHIPVLQHRLNGDPAHMLPFLVCEDSTWRQPCRWHDDSENTGGTSETYSSKAAMETGITSVKNNAPIAPVE